MFFQLNCKMREYATRAPPVTSGMHTSRAYVAAGIMQRVLFEREH